MKSEVDFLRFGFHASINHTITPFNEIIAIKTTRTLDGDAGGREGKCVLFLTRYTIVNP